MKGGSPEIRFAVIGLDHPHIFGITRCLLEAGATLAAFHTDEAGPANAFSREFPQGRRAEEKAKILEDPSIHLIASAAIPRKRAALGIESMRNGKDYLCDKPGFTTLEQLEKARRVQLETGRRYLVYFGERLESRATVRASKLVSQGALGQIVHMTALGPHRVGLFQRPDWFFQPEEAGGILTDLASHQLDQFLHFTNSGAAEVVSASVGNVKHPQYPEFEDLGEVTVRSPHATGMIRVDWLTPPGLGAWGDGRLFLLGTKGYLEVRKVCDLAGRPGGDHLFLVDQQETSYLDCRAEPLPFGRQLLADIRNGTSKALPQDHCFLASELALQAQAKAQPLWIPET